MESISVCKGCGRAIEKEFIYCPWCGYSRVREIDETVGEVIERLEKLEIDTRDRQLGDMERQLDELETELNMLVLSSEMHK